MSELRTFRVCTSKQLPISSQRSSNFIYFTYDTLIVYLGQVKYSDPYAIVETLPKDPARGVMYFCLDTGLVKFKDDLEVNTLAKIESDDQLEILKQSGTMFFYNARSRYLDKQTKTVSLPYQNGTYELTVALANELKINENTVIRYNVDTNQFEISGDIEDYGQLNTYGYSGKNTSTATTTVVDGKISTEVKVSKAYDNLLKNTSGGLFVSATDKVSREEFEGLRSNYQDYKGTLEYYLKTIQAVAAAGQDLVNRDSINAKIAKALENAYPDIDKAVKNYDELLADIRGIEGRSKEYTDIETNEAKNDILETTYKPWEIIGSPSTEDVTTDGFGEPKKLNDDYYVDGEYTPPDVIINQRDSQISELRAQNNLLTLNNQDLTNRLSTSESQVNNLTTQVESLQTENDTLKKKLSDAQLGEEKTNLITSTAIAAFLETSNQEELQMASKTFKVTIDNGETHTVVVEEVTETTPSTDGTSTGGNTGDNSGTTTPSTGGDAGSKTTDTSTGDKGSESTTPSTSETTTPTTGTSTGDDSGTTTPSTGGSTDTPSTSETGDKGSSSKDNSSSGDSGSTDAHSTGEQTGGNTESSTGDKGSSETTTPSAGEATTPTTNTSSEEKGSTSKDQGTTTTSETKSSTTADDTSSAKTNTSDTSSDTSSESSDTKEKVVRDDSNSSSSTGAEGIE